MAAGAKNAALPLKGSGLPWLPLCLPPWRTQLREGGSKAPRLSSARPTSHCRLSSLPQEHDIETPYGLLHVVLRGSARGNRPALLTYHDVGLNRKWVTFHSGWGGRVRPLFSLNLALLCLTCKLAVCAWLPEGHGINVVSDKAAISLIFADVSSFSMPLGLVLMA